MQCFKNSGWLYYIGDSIFGDVLLVNADGLYSVCDVYASSVTVIDNASTIVNGNIKVPKDGFDCIIVNATGDLEGNAYDMDCYLAIIKDNGRLAVMRDIYSDIAALTSIYYPVLFLKGLFKAIIKKYKDTILTRYDVRNYYIRSVGGRINQVLYKNGYQPVKNTFLFKEKIRKLFLSKYIYPLFSSNVLTVISRSNVEHTTVVDNVIGLVEEQTGIIFKEIVRSSIIPFKVLVSVKAENGQSYIFLLLRGAGGNVRANKELDMINYINTTYQGLSVSISKSLAHGFYNNLEYIVYKELPGVNIDANFDRFNVAEVSAFNQLISLGEATKKNIVINEEVYNDLYTVWLKKLKQSKEENAEFTHYIDEISQFVFSILNQTSCLAVLFHGDYKIENLLFDDSDYSVTGVIDWDLSEKVQLPALDLLYFILYSRRIFNHTSFIEESDAVFLGDGFTNHEIEMITKYCEKFSISSTNFNIICIVFLWHHFSCRECGDFEEEWLISVLDSIKSKIY